MQPQPCPSNFESDCIDQRQEPPVENDAERTSAAAASEPPSVRKVGRGWSRTDINFILDGVLLLTFSAILCIAAIIRFIFPPALSAVDWRLWGRTLEQWHDLLLLTIGVFAGGILLHVMLHWSWICGVVAKKLSKWTRRSIRIDEASQTIWGVSLLIVSLAIIAFILVVAASSVQRH